MPMNRGLNDGVKNITTSMRTIFIAKRLRQVGRPTFKISGLGDICNFMEYRDVYSWFKRMKGV